MSRRQIVVLDASAFIAGFDPFAVDGDLYTVPAIGEELSESSLCKLRFHTAVERGKLKLCEPRSRHMNAVKESSKEIGDMLFLSRADMQILALALQLKEDGYVPTIVTDDYSIQNVARKIRVDFASLATFGIRFYLHWTLYCPACHKKYPADHEFDRCEVCGTRLKRKPQEKSPVNEAAQNHRPR